MNPALIESIANNPKFNELVIEQGKLKRSLTLIIALTYTVSLFFFSFADKIALIDDDTLFFLQILFYCISIFLPIVIIRIYAHQASTNYDRKIEEILKEAER